MSLIQLIFIASCCIIPTNAVVFADPCTDIATLNDGTTYNGNICSSSGFSTGINTIINGAISAVHTVELGLNSQVFGTITAGDSLTTGVNCVIHDTIQVVNSAIFGTNSIVYGNIAAGTTIQTNANCQINGCITASNVILGPDTTVSGTAILTPGTGSIQYGAGAIINNGSTCASSTTSPTVIPSLTPIIPTTTIPTPIVVSQTCSSTTACALIRPIILPLTCPTITVPTALTGTTSSQVYQALQLLLIKLNIILTIYTEATPSVCLSYNQLYAFNQIVNSVCWPAIIQTTFSSVFLAIIQNTQNITLWISSIQLLIQDIEAWILINGFDSIWYQILILVNGWNSVLQFCL
jgi:predicted acyltransferase (DUF342 family)